MSIQDRTTGKPATPRATPPAKLIGDQAVNPTRLHALAVLRVVMGLVFLWAFLDKTFGFGYATTAKQAWINGGSPAKGFLSHVEAGPFRDMFQSWAGSGWADWLFMIGLLGIGLALVLGVGMRLAATTGVVLLAFMWAAEWPPAQHTATGSATSSTNPIIDYHFVFAVLLIVLAVHAAGDVWGFGWQWAKQDIVQRYPWLR